VHPSAPHSGFRGFGDDIAPRGRQARLQPESGRLLLRWRDAGGLKRPILLHGCRGGSGGAAEAAAKHRGQDACSAAVGTDHRGGCSACQCPGAVQCPARCAQCSSSAGSSGGSAASSRGSSAADPFYRRTASPKQSPTSRSKRQCRGQCQRQCRCRIRPTAGRTTKTCDSRTSSAGTGRTACPARWYPPAPAPASSGLRARPEKCCGGCAGRTEAARTGTATTSSRV
jgi:hypothetical protein